MRIPFFRFQMIFIIGGLLAGAGCIAPPGPPPSGQPTTMTPRWADARLLIDSICFEAALELSGRIFVIQGADDLTALYDLVDARGLCRRPVERVPYPYEDDAVITGTWQAGRGCTADYDVMALNDDGRTLRMQVTFRVEGDCPYDLVRPFWVVFEDRAGYPVTLDVVSPSS
jgi:hypothetical protein